MAGQSKNKEISNPGLVSKLAAIGIHVTPGQPAASPAKNAQRAADFARGVTYSPINNGPIRQLAPGVRAAPANLNGGIMTGSRPPMTGPVAVRPMNPRPLAQPFFGGFNQYQGPARDFSQQQMPQQPQGYQPDVMGPLRAFDQQNPWRGPSQPNYAQGPDGAPMQKPTWMSTSLWALYNLDRTGR